MAAETTDKRVIKVAVLTPYLTADFAGYKDSEEKLKVHIEKFGYDPNNFKGIDKLVTPKHVVLLEKNEKHTVPHPALCDFAVAGSTESMEDAVMSMRGSGIIAARYSTFYNGSSRYTGNSPEESGYSLDIPKKMEVVRAFLTNDGVLESILSREINKIKSALKEFNVGLAQPVLVTPFLAEALKVRR
jgi:hypothetical protein